MEGWYASAAARSRGVGGYREAAKSLGWMIDEGPWRWRFRAHSSAVAVTTHRRTLRPHEVAIQGPRGPWPRPSAPPRRGGLTGHPPASPRGGVRRGSRRGSRPGPPCRALAEQGHHERRRRKFFGPPPSRPPSFSLGHVRPRPPNHLDGRPRTGSPAWLGRRGGTPSGRPRTGSGPPRVRRDAPGECGRGPGVGAIGQDPRADGGGEGCGVVRGVERKQRTVPGGVGGEAARGKGSGRQAEEPKVGARAGVGRA
jgi:hypothetical protein